MSAYYNEIDPYAAQWLRNLIAAGEIAPGVVDERSIEDVLPDDLKGFTQCHFFAGIGGWSTALRQARWADDRPVWTGSCPCQPFSAAGAGKAADDERHLWPAWFSLIAQRRPPVVFGEQVEAAIGWGWLDAVFADLEKEGYACGASVLPACGVGSPHIRQRLWFVGHADRAGCETWDIQRSPTGARSQCLEQSGSHGALANANGGDASPERQQRCRQYGQQPQDGGDGALDNAAGHRFTDRDFRDKATQERPSFGKQSIDQQNEGRGWPDIADAGANDFMADSESGGQREQRHAPQPGSGGHPDGGFWSGAEWIACTDGKSRPIEPRSFPLAHGVQRRPSKLRAYGNAIVPQVAAEFIAAFGDAMTSMLTP